MILYLALILQNWVLPIPHFVAAGLLLVALAIFALFSPVKSKYFGVAQQLILNAYNKVSVSLFRYRGIFLVFHLNLQTLKNKNIRPTKMTRTASNISLSYYCLKF